MTKLSFDFKGFEDLAAELSQVEGRLEAAAQDGLTRLHLEITPDIEAAIAPHHRSGHTESTIKRDAAVSKAGKKFSVGVGFKLPQGLAAQFLMHGTPRVKADRKLYNAVFGSKPKAKLKECMKEAMNNALR